MAVSGADNLVTLPDQEVSAEPVSVVEEVPVLLVAVARASEVEVAVSVEAPAWVVAVVAAWVVDAGNTTDRSSMDLQ